MNKTSTKAINRKCRAKILCTLFLFLFFFIYQAASAQTINFSSSALIGENLSNPTSLDFGPDNRLYVSQQNGTIYAYKIVKNGPNNYSVSATETILNIKNIPNHNDDGTVNTTVTNRQITGLLVVGTNTNPVIYVSSSDPRIGGGGTAGDQNLDTNSGIISKLTWNGTAWIKVDVVKGLPRSEENHSSNGLALDAATNMLYLSSGGHTNAGSPSNNFAFLSEYALSGAILKIDLGAISSQYGGSYTLPTLDDPTRANSGPNGADVGDPWGGNDGLNQAKIVANGPVQIHSAGYRNAYDVVLTKTAGKSGRMYTIDNGANSGWGGFPDKEGTPGVTNKYVTGEPGSLSGTLTDAKVNNLDNLHLVSAPGITPIYGGHPNPIRANPAGAGLYRYDNKLGQGVFSLTPTADWPPVPVSMADAVEADFRNPGVNDGALYTWTSSTNGITEYTASNFNSSLKGDLLATSFDGNLYRIQLSSDGTQVSNVSILAGGFGSQPLDVTTQGDNEVYPGTIWVATYGGNNITIIEPVIPAETWSNVSYNTSGAVPEVRHENGFVEVNGKFYLVGGRVVRNVNIFNPSTKIWTVGAASPVELTHFQAVAYKGDIYAVCAMNGPYPNEVPLNNIYKYSPSTNTWSIGASIPVARRRGSAGVVVYNDKFYIVGGIKNGHIDGWVPWVDEYNPATGAWTILPDAPVARDHFMTTLINGKIYAAGGRQTHYPDFAANTIARVDVYDIATKIWSTPTNIPTQRGAPGVAYINSELVIAGGEISSTDNALTVVESYNPVTKVWKTKPGLDVGRQATQMISYQGKLYLCAGSKTKGGGGQNNTMSSATIVSNCTGDNTNFNLDDDNDGYSNGDETLNSTDPCSSASKPLDADLDGLSDLIDPDDDNDGLSDKIDKFPVDKLNGLNTNLPVNYPFLNGNPGAGLFGLGFTGLMTNGTTDYKDEFDTNKANLIMGGAVGVATTPAEAGDALTNNQKYAFQFGINVNQNTPPFSITSKLLGSSFFDGATGTQLGNQSQGIFFGTGDQNNYLKLVLHANNANPGFQILMENNGIVTFQNIYPVSNILAASSIQLFIDVNPKTGLVQCKYQTNSASSPVNVGPALTMTGNILNVLQDNNAVAVGVIACSGNKPPYTASWDYLNINGSSAVTNLPPIITKPSDITLTSGQSWSYQVKATDPDVGAVLNYSASNLPASLTINPTTGLISGNISGVSGTYTVNLIVKDQQNLAANSSFIIHIVSPTTLTEIARINAGGGNIQFGTELWKADQYFTGGRTTSTTTAISNTTDDALYQTERYGNMTYSIPVPQAGKYTVELHFAEIYFKTAGSRIFTVDVEGGQYRMQDVDLYRDYGGAFNAAIVKAQGIQVNDGMLTVNFTNVVDNAKISGIAVFKESPIVSQPPIVTKPANVWLTSGQSWTYQISASDPNAGAVLVYSATNLPASLTLNSSTGLITGTVSAAPGTYTVNVSVKDQFNLTATTSFIITVIPLNDLTEVVRLNAGGPTIQYGNELWKFDQYFTGGNTYTNTANAINNTLNDAIYQSERNGNMSYNIPVPKAGKYTIELDFAELYHNSPGQRVFNVNIENGQFLLQNVDLFKDYGGKFYASIVKAANIQVDDGALSIIFTSVVDRAKISGIGVWLQNVAIPNQPPVANAGPDKIVYLPTSSVLLSGVGSDPEDGTNVKFNWSQVSGPAAAIFNDPTKAATTVSNLVAGTYIFGLKVTDQQLLSSSIDLVKVTVAPIGPTQQIVSYTLINALTEQDILTIPPNSTLNLATLPSQSLNIRANTNPATVGSVVFALTGAQTRNYTESGAPYSLFGDNSGNYASWTPSVGSYILTATPYSGPGATGNPGTPLTINFKVINQPNRPPVISKPANITLTQGQIYQYNILASDPDENTVLTYSSSNLPTSLTTNAQTGVISGTVTAAAGVYTVTLSVSDQFNLKATTTYSITVKKPNAPPVITQPVDMVAFRNLLFKYQVIAVDPEDGTTGITYSALGLPAGLSINTATGEISGTVTAAIGQYLVTLKAKDQFGLAANDVNFKINVSNANSAPVISPPVDQVAIRNQSFNYQVSATDPEDGKIGLLYSATNLPSGLSIDSSTGLISGTVTVNTGDYIVNLGVKDKEGLSAVGVNLKITVKNPNQAPIVIQPANQVVYRNEYYSLQISASDPEDNQNGLVFYASGLPTGLAINTANGLIYGNVTADIGVYNVVLSVKDQYGLASNPVSVDFSVINRNQPPTITQPADQIAVNNKPFSYQVLAYDTEDGQIGLVYSATGLPGGLTIDSSNGLISGTVNANLGEYFSTLIVKDKDGASSAVSLKITVIVGNQPPTIIQPADQIAIYNKLFSYQVSASDPEDGLNGLAYFAAGLPDGLIINSTNGLISGTPNAALGVYNTTLLTKDKEGNPSVEVSFKITLIADNQPPIITQPIDQYAAIGNYFEYQVSASDPEDGKVGLNYAASGLPLGLIINNVSGLISGTVNDVAGDYFVKLLVNDSSGQKSAEVTFKLTIANNTPPSLTQPVNQTAINGQNFNYQILATDPDINSTLSYSASGLPKSLLLDSKSGLISGYLNEIVGIYPIALTVTDNYGAVANASFDLTVNNAPAVASNSIMLKGSVDAIEQPNNFIDPYTIFPNPVDKEFSVKLEVKKRSEWKFTMYNTLGIIIHLPSLHLEEGVQISKFDLSPYNLVPGMYYLIITNNMHEKKSCKILIR